MDSREQAWMDALDSVKNGYNTAPFAGSNRGVKHSAEARKRKAQVTQQLWEDPEYRTKSCASRKRVMADPEVRERLSIASTSASNKPGVKERQREAAKARADDPVWLEKVSDGHRRSWASLSEDERKLRYARMQAGMSDEVRAEKCEKTKQAMRNRSVLTEEDVSCIRKRYKFRSPTDGARALSKEFKVSPSMIEQIVHGKAWGSEGAQEPHKTASGYKGVTKDGNRWRGRLSVNGIAYDVGYFDTPEEAYSAVERKRAELREDISSDA